MCKVKFIISYESIGQVLFATGTLGHQIYGETVLRTKMYCKGGDNTWFEQQTAEITHQKPGCFANSRKQKTHKPSFMLYIYIDSSCSVDRINCSLVIPNK